MQMLTDNPIMRCAQDRFGFREYAELLAESILDTPSLPFCLGLFGPWGTGKTSLMRMIEDSLRDRNEIKTIWFNPWKYDKQEALWSALIQSVLYEVSERGGAEVKAKAKELAASTAWILVRKAIGSATGGIMSERSLDKLKDAFLKQDELYHRHMNQFEQDFERVVNLYTGGGSLIVFVDDLDRCLPENALTVLESLKLFVGNAKCVFVLAMDPFIVEQGITSRYGDTLKMSGRDYLDKIIQIPFFLPPVPFARLREAVSVAKTADYDQRIWRLLELGLAGNPRKTIRFVNCFYLLRQIVESDAATGHREGPGQDPALFGLEPAMQRYFLAKLMVFQLAFDKFYGYLQAHPDAWSVFEKQLLGDESPEARQKVFRQQAGLEEFWKDERLKVFLEHTAEGSTIGDGETFPTAPDPNVVRLLMKAISLVGQSSDTVSESARESAEQASVE